FRRMPALIAAHHLPGQRRAVNALGAGPGEGLHRLLDDLLARELGLAGRGRLGGRGQLIAQEHGRGKQCEESDTSVWHAFPLISCYFSPANTAARRLRTSVDCSLLRTCEQTKPSPKRS